MSEFTNVKSELDNKLNSQFTLKENKHLKNVPNFVQMNAKRKSIAYSLQKKKAENLEFLKGPEMLIVNWEEAVLQKDANKHLIEVEELYEISQPNKNFSLANSPNIHQNYGFELQKSIDQTDYKNPNFKSLQTPGEEVVYHIEKPE